MTKKKIKATARSAAERTIPKIRDWLLAVRDRPRFGESADEYAAAIKALQALDAGDIDTAMFCAVEIGHIQGIVEANVKAEERFQGMSAAHTKLWNQVYDRKEAKHRKSIRVYGPKLEKAIERFLQLRNERGDKKTPSDFYLRRKAAAEADISERYLRDNIPPL
jgi:hypothetical protein